MTFTVDQQVERKRHIGNDIVNIVYVDGGATQMSQFNPAFIKSQFTRILFFLKKRKKNDRHVPFVLRFFFFQFRYPFVSRVSFILFFLNIIYSSIITDLCTKWGEKENKRWRTFFFLYNNCMTTTTTKKISIYIYKEYIIFLFELKYYNLLFTV